ncbi:MAG: DUF1801 domain-containing protein [Chloroflexota bacterium]
MTKTVAPAKAAPKAVRAANADGRPAVVAWLKGIEPAQRGLARRLDQLILDAVPGAVSAVKFRKPTNPLGVPFYGLPDKAWIVSMNSLKGRVRVNFFSGNALKPLPPLAAPPRARAIDLPPGDELDEKQIKAWLRQAKTLPGWGRV